MKTSFISTSALFDSGRLALMRMQQNLATAQSELSSGRHADQGVTLGHNLARTVSLRGDHSRLSAIVDTNNLVAARLETSQNAMAGMQSLAEDFMATVISARDGDITVDIAVQAARSALAQLSSHLNATQNGEYMFAGINTAQAPFEDYLATPPAAGKLAVDGAFFGAFGISQSDPGVAAIAPGDMQTFLDGNYATLFDPAGWPVNFSNASDQNLESRIAVGTQVETGTNGNEEAFRDLTRALVMVADLGAAGLNEAARDVVFDSAIAASGRATSEIISLRANMGLTQERVQRANDAAQLQVFHLNEQVASLEAADPFETATRINRLISQIEVSYALTSRISQLSLANRI